MNMLTITMLVDLEGVCFCQSFLLHAGQDYLAERTSIDSLRVHGEQFAGGSVLVGNVREGRDFRVGKRFSRAG